MTRFARPAVAALAAILLAAAAGAALSEDAPVPVASAGAPPTAPAGATADEVQQFCANIADAARDRRYSLQVMELEKLKKDVDERIARLEEKRAEYEAWMKRRDDFMARTEGQLVDIYAQMKPDAAATRLAAVDPMLAASIILKLNTRQAGQILNEMDSKSAAALTDVLASAAKPKDPS